MLTGPAIAGFAILMFSASAHGQFTTAGTWQNFTIISAEGLTNTGFTVVEGNIALFPNASFVGFPPGLVVNGSVYSAPNPISQEIARIARTDAFSAYSDLQNAISTSNLTGIDLGTLPALTPGVYTFDSSAQLTGTLELNANVANSIFIFQVNSALTTASNANVIISGANAGCARIYWQIGSSATIGTDTNFLGTIIANESVTLTTGATLLNGRAIGLTAAVTLDTNNVASLAPGPFCPPDTSALPMVTASMLTAEELTAIFQMGFSGAAAQNLSIQRHLESVRRGGGSPPTSPH
ncbi:MAG: ice-binding family protein [Verrucomicrobiota bacterium]